MFGNWPWISLSEGEGESWTLWVLILQLTGLWLCLFARDGGVFWGSQTTLLLCCFTHWRISYRTSPRENQSVQMISQAQNQSRVLSFCIQRYSYLSWGTGVWSLLWSAGRGLCRSSRSVLSLAGAVSTPSEPSVASGQHPLYPTEMDLYLEYKHIT